MKCINNFRKLKINLLSLKYKLGGFNLWKKLL